MAVEFVIVAPAFIALLLLIGAGGQWVSAEGEVSAAARDAARQVSLEISFASVQQAAQSTAQADLNNVCPGAAQATVDLDGKPASAADWVTAQTVEVTVTCKVNLKAFTIIGIPATPTIPANADAPLDPFSQRTGG